MKITKLKKNLIGERFDLNSQSNCHKLWGSFSRKRPEHGLKEQDYRRLMSNFWDLVAQATMDGNHGVLLDGIGYFAMPVFYTTNYFKGYKVHLLPENTPIHTPYFFNQVFKSNYFANFRFKPTRRIVKTVSKNTRAGKRYSCHYHHLKRITGKKTKHYLKKK